MKGINYITDQNHKRKAVVIDLKIIQEDEESIHELIDTLSAESRKNDELIDWELAKKQLKKAGRL